MPEDSCPRACVITILNLKGGVGKTHASWLLASVCQERGKRILLIDLDTQGNLSGSFLPETDRIPGVEMLFNPGSDQDLTSLIRHSTYAHLDIVPASAALARFDLSDQKQWENADLHLSLIDAMREMKNHYDYLVFDCPPRLSLVSLATWSPASSGHAHSNVRTWKNFAANLATLPLTRYSPICQHSSRVSPIASPSPPTPGAVEQPPSPAPSSMKSSGALLDPPQAALHAARAAFSRRPQLSLDEDTIAHAGALAKRTRLAGAFLIESSRIRPDPSQPRKSFDTKSQVELTGSIERLGILQPITVRFVAEDDIYQIITGERRFQAAKAADVQEIPCWVQTPKSEDVLVHQIVENWQRSDLHPYDLADALAALRDANGYSQKELSRLTGKPESEISRFLKLLTLNPAAQDQARHDETGAISKRHLVAIADLPAAEQEAFVKTVQETRMTATEAERVVSEKKAMVEGRKTRGAPIGLHFRYKTKEATVTVVFRRKNIGARDILAALDEARRQIKEDQA